MSKFILRRMELPIANSDEQSIEQAQQQDQPADDGRQTCPNGGNDYYLEKPKEATSETEQPEPGKLAIEQPGESAVATAASMLDSYEATNRSELENEIDLRDDEPEEVLAAQDEELRKVQLSPEEMWDQQVRDAEKAHFEAAIRQKDCEDELKSAKKEVKEALNYAMELKARGPSHPPVKKPQPVVGGAAAAEASGEVATEASSAPNNDESWKSIPITDLPLDSIKGLGAAKKGKKYQALIDAIPTLGVFEEKRVEAGINGLHSVMPDNIGQTVSDALEEIYLNFIMKFRPAVVEAESKSPETSEAKIEGGLSSSPAETHSAGDSIYPTFEAWETLSDEARSRYINDRGTQLNTGEPNSLAASEEDDGEWQSGYDAYNQSVNLGECPRVPGMKMDDWIRGWFAAEKIDIYESTKKAGGKAAEKDAETAEAEEIEEIESNEAESGELVAAGSAASESPGLGLVSVDDI